MASKPRVEQDRYFADALAWLRDRHGADNVVYAGIHRDETTPHLYAYVVPLDGQGKLNCRAFYGGADALRNMQSDFADRVGKRHGLDRGIEGSRAKHTTVRQFYEGISRAEKTATTVRPVLLAKAMEPRTIEEGRLFKAAVVETQEQIAERLARNLNVELKSRAIAAGGAAVERKKRREAEATAKAKATQIEALGPLAKAHEDLPSDQFAQVVNYAQGLQRAHQIAKEAARRATELAKELARNASSAVGRYARVAIEAIKAAGDHAHVAWEQVDRSWASDALAGRDGSKLGVITIARVVLDHSPGNAGMTKAERDQVMSTVSAPASAPSQPEPRWPGPAVGG